MTGMRVPEVLAQFDDKYNYTLKMIVDDRDIADSDEIVYVRESNIYRSNQFVQEFAGKPVLTIYSDADSWSIEFPVATYATLPNGTVLLYGDKGTAEFTPQLKA